MRRAAALALTLALGFANPARAQLWYFPNVAVETGGGITGAYVALDVARGMNDASGKIDGIGGSFGFMGQRAGLRLSAASLAGSDGGDRQTTAGGAFAFDLLPTGSQVQFALQGGAGWIELLDVSLWHLPVGGALKFTFTDDP